MKVLMFGWEFPPFNMGGLGTACHGLTKGLVNEGHEVTFVLPKANTTDAKSHVNLLVANNYEINSKKLKMTTVDSLLGAYVDTTIYGEKYKEIMKIAMQKKESEDDAIYGKNLFDEVYRFSEKAKLIAAFEDFNVIHAHDWMTFEAGVKAKSISGKPLVVHVHATEFDRTGGNGVNQYVYDIERRGMHLADKVIAVSNYTKNMITTHYGVDPAKVEVVHNAVEFNDYPSENTNYNIKKHNKIVLFLGRITLQKGPDYFLNAAKKVLEKEDNVTFVVAGSGDMENAMIRKASDMGIGDKVLFSGYLRGPDIDRAFSMADVYVMPSVSEPFGITPLEAMRNGTPCVISKQSGVSEVLTNCLKVDFWDVHHTANCILSLLRYNELHNLIKHEGGKEIKTISWDTPAKKCAQVYSNALGSHMTI